MPYAIEVIQLKKKYGKQEVLKGVDLCIHQGEIFGILGVNGAGKTTLLECMENFRKYDSGTVNITGSMAMQLQSASLPAYMKVKEAIQLFTKWKHAQVEYSLLHSLGISHLQNKLYSELSAGQKRKLHLALALIEKPNVLFLDEPTTELDVESKISLHDLILKLNQNGTTIVLSSHDMAEVETLCHRIAILNNGVIDFVGSNEALAEKTGKKYTITIVSSLGKKEYSVINLADSLLTILEKYKKKNIPIHDLQVQQTTLQEHFISFTKEDNK